MMGESRRKSVDRSPSFFSKTATPISAPHPIPGSSGRSVGPPQIGPGRSHLAEWLRQPTGSAEIASLSGLGGRPAPPFLPFPYPQFLSHTGYRKGVAGCPDPLKLGRVGHVVYLGEWIGLS